MRKKTTTGRRQAGTNTVKKLTHGRSPPPAEQDALVALFNAGRLAEVETLARQFAERYPKAAFGWKALGTALLARGRHHEALTTLQRATEIAPRDSECLNSLGKTLQDLGRAEDALGLFERTLSIKPDYAGAHANRGNALALLGRPAEGLASLDRALSINPDSPIALNDRGNVLKALNRPEEALASYAHALALKPDFAQAHYNMGSVLRELGRLKEGLRHYRRALEFDPESIKVRSGFARCLGRLSFQHEDPAIRRLLIRALREAWCRPNELMTVGRDFLQLNPALVAAIQRAERAWPNPVSREELLGTSGIAALADDELLVALLETTPICDVGLERLLTLLRRSLLETVCVENSPSPAWLRLFPALAMQCYLNEYVYAVTADERALSEALRESLATALQCQIPVTARQLAILAAYCPLDRLPGAATLLERDWPEPVMKVLIQQLREPLEQAEYRRGMPSLSGIGEGVSQLVRNQYEENPYPRWARAALVPPTLTVDAHVRQQFPGVPFRSLRKHANIDILVAGCGTGQHSIETALNFPGAQVLAIDLSLSSLAYAQRKTLELGLTNIRYAQADLLRLDGFDAQFDLIESVGVLHHLEDPVAGWKMLLTRLRPGGFMYLGLYSERARRPVVMARDLIARQGYAATADDIRRCRQDIMDRRDQAEYRQLSLGQDFFSLSGCRDLLFHVQEHRFTLPRIAKLLCELELDFLGFIVDQQTRASYARRFPDDPTATGLDHWDRFEADNPTTFSGMYQFWVQKRC
ncbi:tetratricopeptide repeat protein [Thiocystis violascens]|uniref:Tetratricopeptide repeat protein,methyltransferase family protein n=1 Tax=Thiocystis violascens (strain ATCC 17096 / DSM 198 / 6111) TaxID=765911 RepID=I3Y7E7_THIV6|nr:tetratricopeptide repeat protein [Thiocystis violascens]AFL72915.1 tetratricopeptide repeat protein,methyltransferase family protein [Thiocystis violascens DSM 198]